MNKKSDKSIPYLSLLIRRLKISLVKKMIKDETNTNVISNIISEVRTLTTQIKVFSIQ